ncbi:MAG: Smr/MutS family protein [Nitrospiria bacterium]
MKRRRGEEDSTRLDLHGQRVEEAIEHIERFLDQAMLSREREVSIIHGHGSGRLKKAVRAYLSQSPYVDAFRPGSRWEGGDGVTVVILLD